MLTVMSYNEATSVATWFSAYGLPTEIGYPSTLMPLDVLALQYIYGPNLVTRAGNSNYALVDDNRLETFWDAGGIDTLVVQPGATGWYIDLGIDVGEGQLVALAVPTAWNSLTTGKFYFNIENATGGGFADTLLGSAEANILNGGAGADHLEGYGGNDRYFVDDPGDIVVETRANGTDWVIASVSYALPAHVEWLTLTGASATHATGNALDNYLGGNAADNTLYGGLGADYFEGRAGNDRYVVDNSHDVVVETAANGTDWIIASVSYALPDHVEWLSLTGAAAINATGNALANYMVGNDASNVLDGGEGADVFVGKGGNDYYRVDHPGDVVVETAANGTDWILASVSYALPDQVEWISLVGAAAINATGNALDNYMVGNDANNVLDGGEGADVLVGKGGNDYYRVDDPGDVVFESAANGTDWVIASVSYALPAHVEWLTLTGASATHATGNALDNYLGGNAADNTLYGGLGADYFEGRAGNDRYVVDNSHDVVVETAANGTDWIIASVSYALPDHVEWLSLTGAAAINATGNALANYMVGNDASNVLDGGEGADVFVGKGGNDYYRVDHPGDVVVETAANGTDWILASVSYALPDQVEWISLVGAAAINATGNALDNYMVGNDANNVLDGGEGADVLVGKGGNDYYRVDDPGDVVFESAANGTDWVIASVSYALPAHVEWLTLTGASATHATGNALDNYLGGNAADNTLYGGLGADYFEGRAGNDRYVVDNSHDVVVETAANGTDWIIASVSYALPDHVEWLSLTGAAAINATGNALANYMVGNDASNVLDGGEGADVLVGKGGNDNYRVDDLGDVVVETAANGTDWILASVSYALPAHVEWLTLTGASATHATGNALDNYLGGNAADNTLSGGPGADFLEGRAGDDILVGGSGSDRYLFADGHGHDSIADFRHDLFEQDRIDLSRISDVDSFADVEVAATRTGDDTLLSFGTSSVLLVGIDLETLEPEYFIV
ncbi:MAG: hypothetical protein H6977_06120 [Gammaproteobacteria bacterium]|nr:hypothetical protein [Gammaproteobacteria bacterium]